MSNLYFNNVEKVGQLYLEYVFFEFESEPIKSNISLFMFRYSTWPKMDNY